MFGRAYVVTGSSQSIQVPATAIWEREGLHFVYVVNAEGVARLRLVTVGDRAGERTTILSGLSPGERIVTKGRETLRDGDKVGVR
jgi:multidrug efflux pump subunit AcrA (membrane-fusion protein)